MWRALLRKEWRDARPFAALGLFFVALELADAAFTHPDVRALGRTWSDLAGAPTTLVYLLIAFALGSGLLRREQEEQTQGFLDGLPVTRSQVLLSKLAVGLPVALVYPFGGALWALGCHLLSRDSMDPSWHLLLLVQYLGAAVLVTALGLALGLLLSFLGRLNWLALGLLASAVLGLKSWLPWVELFNPSRLTGAEVVHGVLRAPGGAVAAQLSVLAAALGATGLLYAREQAPRGEGRRRSVVGVAVGLCTVAVGVLAVGLALYPAMSEGPRGVEELPGARFEEPSTVRARTRHYDVSYPSTRVELAQALLAQADSAFEAARDFLGAPGDEVGLDLFGSSPNTLGTAYWSRVRMVLEDDERENHATLVHETTHVLAGRLAREGETSALSQMAVFNEGLAYYVQLRFASPDEWRETELMAAVVRARRQARDEVLFDVSALVREHDVMLQYALGALLVRALVELHGEQAPPRVLRAAGRPEAPRGVSALARWQDAFQAAGYDLTQVLHRYGATLDALADSHRAQADELPRLRGALEEAEDAVGIRPVFDGQLPAGWSVIARFRPSAAATATEYEAPRLVEGAFWRARSELQGGTLDYQLGLAGPGKLKIYEDWATARVR